MHGIHHTQLNVKLNKMTGEWDMEIIFTGILIGILFLCCIFYSVVCIAMIIGMGTVVTWIASIVSALAMCWIIYDIRSKKEWSTINALIIMAFFGMVLAIILYATLADPTPSEVKEAILEIGSSGSDIEEISYFWSACLLSQPLYCWIAYKVAGVLEKVIDEKIAKIKSKIQSALERQMAALDEITRILTETNAQYKRADDLLKLFENILDFSLENPYMEARRKRDKHVINKIGEILSENKLSMSLENKTTSDIKLEAEKQIAEKKEALRQVSEEKYTWKEYRMLRKMLNVLGS